MRHPCVLCGRGLAYPKSAICRTCHEVLAARGQKWCNQCSTAIPRATYGPGAMCRACKRGTMAERRARARLCVRCNAPAARRSALCAACHQAIKAEGRAWCNRGLHTVAATDIRRVGICRACDNAHERATRAAPASCATCGASLAGHARCAGCERLLHGQAAAAPLCGLCARDRAAGVPPNGFGTDLEEAA